MQMCVVEMTSRPGSPLFHLEHYIEGKYTKYNSNSGFVRDDNIRLTPQVVKDVSNLNLLSQWNDVWLFIGNDVFVALGI